MIRILGIMFMILGCILMPGTEIIAKESKIASRGKMEGSVSFYADDIEYLEEEIRQLMNECGGGKSHE